MNLDPLNPSLRLLLLLSFLLPSHSTTAGVLVTALDTNSVSITSTIARLTALHPCVEHCLITCSEPCFVTNGGAANNNLASAMACDKPFANACYCATSDAAVSAAASFMPSCASLSCRRGDVDLDLAVMRDLYARYCMAAGFTASGWAGWVQEAAVTTTTTAAAAAAGGGGGGSGGGAGIGAPTAGGVATLVTTRMMTQGGSTVTSTGTLLVVDSPSPGSQSSSADSSTVLSVGLGVGLGVGVPLVLLMAAIVALLFWRRNRPAAVSAAGLTMPAGPPAAKARMGEPVATVTEREIDGRPIVGQVPQQTGQQEEVVGAHHTIHHAISPQPASQDQYEVSGEGARAELFSREMYSTPPPRY